MPSMRQRNNNIRLALLKLAMFTTPFLSQRELVELIVRFKPKRSSLSLRCRISTRTIGQIMKAGNFPKMERVYRWCRLSQRMKPYYKFNGSNGELDFE